MLEKKYDVELIHYNNGVFISNDLYKIRYNEIASKFVNCILNLKEVDVFGTFRKLALVNLEKDILMYKHSLICLGCKLAMHVHTIILCKQNNVTLVADGNTKKQNKYPEQSDKAIELIRDLYAKYGIEYINPIYNLGKKDIKYELLDRGITIQPLEDTCLFSNTFTCGDEQNIIDYINKNLELCDKIIKRSCYNEKN